MQLTSFILFGLVFVDFILLFLIERLSTDSKKLLFKKLVLFIASMLFSAYADVRFALVLGAIIVTTWYFGKKNNTKLGVIVALLALSYFKYTNFFIILNRFALKILILINNKSN